MSKKDVKEAEIYKTKIMVEGKAECGGKWWGTVTNWNTTSTQVIFSLHYSFFNFFIIALFLSNKMYLQVTF